MQALHLQHSAAHRNTKARQLPIDCLALRISELHILALCRLSTNCDCRTVVVPMHQQYHMCSGEIVREPVQAFLLHAETVQQALPTCVAHIVADLQHLAISLETPGDISKV